MKINAQIDVLPLVQQTQKSQRNLLLSTIKGINTTAEQIQKAQQDALKQNFTLRSKAAGLAKLVAVLKPRATTKDGGRLYAELAVGQGAKTNPLLLAGFEDGADREPRKGKNIAVPIIGGPARPSKQSDIVDQFKFTQMKLKAQKQSRAQKKAGARKMYVGQSNTYEIPGVGVFRRLGQGKSELVYAFVEKQQLPKKLGWQARAQGIADKWLSENITREFLRSSKLP